MQSHSSDSVFFYMTTKQPIFLFPTFPQYLPIKHCPTIPQGVLPLRAKRRYLFHLRKSATPTYDQYVDLRFEIKFSKQDITPMTRAAKIYARIQSQRSCSDWQSNLARSDYYQFWRCLLSFSSWSLEPYSRFILARCHYWWWLHLLAQKAVILIVFPFSISHHSRKPLPSQYYTVISLSHSGQILLIRLLLNVCQGSQPHPPCSQCSNKTRSPCYWCCAPAG